MMARRSGTATGKTWAIRAGIGIGAGILLGFVIGAVTVRIIQPPGAIIPDSTAEGISRKPQAENGSATETPETQDSVAPVSGTVVPQLIGLEEGDARNTILRSGFTIGSVTFKTSSAPLGTVLESIPVPGEAVVLPATVSLILSDGKGRVDSLPLFPLR